MKQIQNDMQEVSDKNVLYSEIAFLEDMARLVVEARRTISYTYALRYFIKGRNKQEWLSFLQQEFQNDLEHLAELSETNWKELILSDAEEFKSFKLECVSVTSAVEQHLNNQMTSIIQGMNEIIDEDSVSGVDEVFLLNDYEWTCQNCRH